jgi:hypothetical protein
MDLGVRMSQIITFWGYEKFLSILPGIKTADVYVMWAVTNRNVCFMPERGNHQIALCHQNGKITVDTAQFSVFVFSPVIKAPNCGDRIQTVRYSCWSGQVTPYLRSFDYYSWLSALCPLCGVLNTKQLCAHQICFRLLAKFTLVSVWSCLPYTIPTRALCFRNEPVFVHGWD